MADNARMGPRVTGLGRVFDMVADPEASRAWYREVLGFDGPCAPQRAWPGEPRTDPYSLISHFADDA